MPLLNLSQGKSCQVSDQDAVWLSLLCSWNYHNKGYAYSSAKGLMHVLIAKRMGLNGKIDHKDRNGLNNQRENLRVATATQNQANTCGHKDSTSIYKGVSFDPKRMKWIAQISEDRVRLYIGQFDNELDAALAYDKEAKKRFGDYAFLNFPGVKN